MTSEHEAKADNVTDSILRFETAGEVPFDWWFDKELGTEIFIGSRLYTFTDFDQNIPERSGHVRLVEVAPPRSKGGDQIDYSFELEPGAE